MARILITGASGLLGASLALQASREHQVVGAYHRFPLELPGVTMVQADLAASGAARALIGAHQPTWVVHCAAATDLDRCQREPEWARLLNVRMAQAVARSCRRTGARLAHVSTDAVFDGLEGGYREQDSPRPINVYGETKLEAERKVAEIVPEALILRTNFFGWSLGRKISLAEWFLGRLERGESCPGFTDVWFSPLLADHLAGFILALLERDAQGLMHLPGRTCLSKYAFGVQVAETFGLDASAIRPVSVESADLAAPRPKRVCLLGERAEAILSAPLPELDLGLRDFRQLRSERAGIRDSQARAARFERERSDRSFPATGSISGERP